VTGRKRIALLVALVLVAGCATKPPPPPAPKFESLSEFQSESPQYSGRDCVGKLRPDGSPDYSTSCTGAERLFLEQRFDR
jgi:hypothetical protein